MAPSDQTPTEAELADRKLSPWELAMRATGARLCYGEPVEADGRTVIPVASVEAAGGGGWGRADAGPGEPDSGDAEAAGQSRGKGTGGGLGGWVSATPVGFIEIGPEGTRFRRIIEPVSLARGLAGATVKGVVVWARARQRHRRRR